MRWMTLPWKRSTVRHTSRSWTASRAPALVAELRGARRAAGDFTEDDHQQPLELSPAPRPGQELLDLAQQRVHVAGAGQRVDAWQLDEPRVPPRVLARVAHVDPGVVGAMQHECRNADRRQRRAHVDLPGGCHQAPSLAGTRGEALEALEPRAQLRVGRRGRRETSTFVPSPSAR